MKIHHDISHSGTLDDEKEAITIDPNSAAFLQSLWIDMYSDPEGTVVREIATNAWDSHISVGCTDPIEVELPTQMRPVLVIRDHGRGLSEQEVKEFFGQYGRSSKRDTNEQTGMLGLGCKSPLTYCESFTVVAVKDGWKSMFLITRKEDGGGAYQRIAVEPTDEHNGVEIEIPVQNAEVIERAVARFFRFWEPGTVLVDGERPAHFRDNMTCFDLEDDLTLVESLESDYMVMGGVAYPFDVFSNVEDVEPDPRTRRPHYSTRAARVRWSDNSTALSAYKTFMSSKPSAPALDFEFEAYNRPKVVVQVPIGSINFTPNREALSYTDRTKEVVMEVRGILRALTLIRIQEDIDAAPTPHEALVRYHKHRRTYTKMPLTYRGVKFPTSIRLVPTIQVDRSTRKDGSWMVDEDDGKAWAWSPNNSYNSNTTYSTTSLTASNLAGSRYIIVYGYNGRGLREEVKERAREWLVLNGYAEWQTSSYGKQFVLKGGYDPDTGRDARIAQMIFVKERVPATWLELPQVDYEEIKAIKLADGSKAKTPADKRWRVVGVDGYERKIDTLPDDKLAYVMASARPDDNDLKVLAELGHVVAIVPERRKNRLLKEYPHAETLEEHVKRMVKEWAETVTPEAALLMHPTWITVWHEGWSDLVALRVQMKGHLIDDELVRMLARYGSAEQDARNGGVLKKIAARYGVKMPDLEQTRAPAAEMFSKMIRRYPVMRLLGARAYDNMRRRPTDAARVLNNEYIVSEQVHLDYRTY